jgi:hypothetical protein
VETVSCATDLGSLKYGAGVLAGTVKYLAVISVKIRIFNYHNSVYIFKYVNEQVFFGCSVH